MSKETVNSANSSTTSSRHKRTPRPEQTTASTRSANVQQKQSGGKGVLYTLAGLAIGAGAVYGYNEWQEDRGDKGGPQTEPAVVQPVEKPMVCPQFNPTQINGTADEWRSHADVARGLGSVHFGFSRELNKVIANEARSFMIETGDISKAECLRDTCSALIQSYKFDAEHPWIGQDNNQTRLSSRFPKTVRVATQDLYGSASLKKQEVPCGRIVHATILRTKALAANLNGYSKDEAAQLLDTFGPLMVEPDLAKKAAEASLDNPEQTAFKLADVYDRTADILQSRSDVSAHQATCLAVRKVFGETEARIDPLAFYSYSQTMSQMNGKTRSAVIGSLQANANTIKSDATSWSDVIGKYSGWLLLGGGALAAMAAIKMTKKAGK